MRLPERYEEAVVLFRYDDETHAIAPFAPGRILVEDEVATFSPDGTGGFIPMSLTVPVEDVVRVDGVWLRDDVELTEVPV